MSNIYKKKKNLVSGVFITIILYKHTVSYHLIRHARIHDNLSQFSRIVKTLTTPTFFYDFQFEVIINVLVSSFRFIWIPKIWG